MKLLIKLFEKDILPDFVIRNYIRKLCKQRLADEYKKSNSNLLPTLSSGPIAVETEKANEQHYELPTAFFETVLGKNLKYSSCYWDGNTKNLDEAEDKMLELYCERAELKNGQNILELGCGWGSLSLYMAQKYPGSNISAISNSKTQKIFIDKKAKERNITNLKIITANINDFNTQEKYDRIVSIEMFEHMRNYQLLFEKIASWLNTEGKLFVHIFCHKELSYLFEVIDETDWMSKYFFSGGIMPSKKLYHNFNKHLKVINQWDVNGKHYQKTSRAWLNNMDKNKALIMPIIKQTYGKENATKWWVYWRVFFMSCEELFGFNKGEEWLVTHLLFEKENNWR